MPLLLVDGLEPAEAAAVRAHLAGGCPRCAAYLAEADAALTHLPYALEPVAPPTTARQKLFARLNHESPAEESRKRRILFMPRWLRAGLPAAVAACIAIIVTGYVMMRAMDRRTQQLNAVIDQRNDQVRHLTTQVINKDNQLTIQNAKKRITLIGEQQPNAHGRAFFDDKRRCWHFYAYGLSQLPAKEAYELWFITPYGRKVAALTFKPNEHGDAYVVANVPAEVGPVAALAVTDEPSVGTFQPTGQTHLYGRLE
jgi:anti-sigma-K factor RskA